MSSAAVDPDFASDYVASVVEKYAVPVRAGLSGSAGCE